MRIALATTPGSELISRDDSMLAEALTQTGGSATPAIWSNPNVDWSSFDLVAIRTTWDYHLQLERFLAWVTELTAVTYVVNEPRLIHWNAHKAYLHELEDKGVPIVRTEIVRDMGEIESAVRSIHADTLVVKPEVGASALNTFVVWKSELTEIKSRAREILHAGAMLIQPYIKSIESEGELSAVWIDGQIAHVIQKRPKPGDFRVQIDHGGTNERVAISSEVRDLAHRCISALPYTPVFGRVDLVRDGNDQLRLMELELIEPELMFEWAPESAPELAKALCRAVA